MKLVVANLKMNLTLSEMLEYSKQVNNMKYKNIELVICPSYPYLSAVSLSLNKKDHLGSQDVSVYMKGPYTGEVSSYQLANLGVRYCIVGHSERKKVYNESNLHIISKINNLQEHNIIPILCIENSDKENIKEYLDSIFPNIKKTNDIIIAYEPTESIGTGMILEINKIFEIISIIKEIIETEYKTRCKVLYGGSVDENNCIDILKNDDLDGVLVGKASQDINTFIKLLDKIEVIK